MQTIFGKYQIFHGSVGRMHKQQYFIYYLVPHYARKWWEDSDTHALSNKESLESTTMPIHQEYKYGEINLTLKAFQPVYFAEIFISFNVAIKMFIRHDNFFHNILLNILNKMEIFRRYKYCPHSISICDVKNVFIILLQNTIVILTILSILLMRY